MKEICFLLLLNVNVGRSFKKLCYTGAVDDKEGERRTWKVTVMQATCQSRGGAHFLKKGPPRRMSIDV